MTWFGYLSFCLIMCKYLTCFVFLSHLFCLKFLTCFTALTVSLLQPNLSLWLDFTVLTVSLLQPNLSVWLICFSFASDLHVSVWIDLTVLTVYLLQPNLSIWLVLFLFCIHSDLSLWLVFTVLTVSLLQPNLSIWLISTPSVWLTTSLSCCCNFSFSRFSLSISSVFLRCLVLVISNRAMLASFSLIAAWMASCLQTTSLVSKSPIYVLHQDQYQFMFFCFIFNQRNFNSFKKYLLHVSSMNFKVIWNYPQKSYYIISYKDHFQ